MRLLFVAATLLALGACAQAPAQTATAPVTGAPAATPAPVTPSDPLTQLANFTLADLQAASADAKAQVPPDVTASQCYDYLIALIPTIKIPGGGNKVGAILLFQQARDLNAGLSGQKAALKNLNLACAPLVIDTQTTVNKLLLIGGGAAGIPGLSGLGNLLP